MPAHEKTITFRTSNLIHQWLLARAKENGRSVNSELEQVIKEVMRQEK